MTATATEAPKNVLKIRREKSTEKGKKARAERAPEKPKQPVRWHLLPKNLEGLGYACASEESRYAMHGVRLTIDGDKYHVEATDSKMLIVVDGTIEHDAADFPQLLDLEAAPNGATEAIIPADPWKKAFKSCPTWKNVRGEKIVGQAAVVLGKKVATLATSTPVADDVRVIRAENIEGKYPPVAEVLPKDAPKATIKLDAGRLADLISVLSDFTHSDDDNQTITFEWRGEDKPIVARAENSTQKAVGLLMCIK